MTETTQAQYDLTADVRFGALIAYREHLNEELIYKKYHEAFAMIELVESMGLTIPADKRPSPCAEMNYALNRMRFYETIALIADHQNRTEEREKARAHVQTWMTFYYDTDRQREAQAQEDMRVARAEEADFARCEQD